jgi:hypothetical protein
MTQQQQSRRRIAAKVLKECRDGKAPPVVLPERRRRRFCVVIAVASLRSDTFVPLATAAAAVQLIIALPSMMQQPLQRHCHLNDEENHLLLGQREMEKVLRRVPLKNPVATRDCSVRLSGEKSLRVDPLW